MNEYTCPYWSKGNRFYLPTLYWVKNESYDGPKITGYGNVLFRNIDLIKYPFNEIYRI